MVAEPPPPIPIPGASVIIEHDGQLRIYHFWHLPLQTLQIRPLITSGSLWVMRVFGPSTRNQDVRWIVQKSRGCISLTHSPKFHSQSDDSLTLLTLVECIK